MNVGEGSFCPSCFDRAREQNSPGGGATRYRDYAAIASSGVLFSLITCGFFPGAFAVYWGVKGVRQRRSEGVGIAGPVISIVLGSIETLGLLAMIALLVYVLSITGWGPFSDSSWAKLFIVIGFIPLLVVYTRKNWPRRFKPDAIPQDVLP